MLTRPEAGRDHARAARNLIPLIEAAAPRIESEGGLPDDLLSALHHERLFHMLVPKDVGGEEVDLLTFFRAVEAVASADASAGWCVGQGCGVSMASAYLDRAVAREIFDGPQAVVASGPNNRNARAVKTKDGYRVTAKWTFASGSRHSTWLGGHALVYDEEGTQLKTKEGKPVERTMLFHKSKAHITNDWEVMGLRGTGSDSYEVTDLFVPDEHSFTRDSVADRRVSSPLYNHFTGFNIFGLSFAAVSLGIARATLDAFITLAAKKSPQSAQGQYTLAENAVIQSKVALAEARLRSARGFVLDVYGRLWEQAEHDQPFSLQDKAEMRLASTFAMNEGREIVDFAYHAAGGTAVFQKNPFERRFRDINCASQQGQASPANFELIGQVFLGQQPKGRI